MVTADSIRTIPTAKRGEKGSPNINIPTITAVIGSIAPRTEARVPPIRFTAITSVMFEITVGTIASSVRLHIAPALGIGCTLPSLMIVFIVIMTVLTRKT